MLFVLDTNVISEPMKPEAEATVLKWFLRHAKQEFITTAISQAEILGGLGLLPEGKRLRGMLLAAQAIWSEDLKQRVLPFSHDCADAFALILRGRADLGKPIHFADTAIAAICAYHKAAIVTRYTEDFKGCGIQMENPWLG
jgi:toxin FitB